MGDLNKATKDKLLKVDQIGQGLADRLLEAGPFQDWGAVRAVPQIGPKRVANLQRMFFIGKSPVQDWVHVPASQVPHNLGKSTADDQLTKQQIIGQTGKDKMCLNTATKEQLMQADHIGLAFARDLINARPFGCWDEVAKLSGIGKVRLANLQSLFVLPTEVRKGVVSDPELPGTVFKFNGKEFVVGDSKFDSATSAISELSFVSASSGWSMLSANGPHCFLPRTLLPCFPRNYQSVDSFQTGDVVLSAEGEPLKITFLKVHDVAPRKCVELCVGDVTNCFTASHRISIFRGGRQQAVKADTLRPGDDVIVAGGEIKKLDVATPFTQETSAYEFTFHPDRPVESYPMQSGAILSHGRGMRRSHRRASFNGGSSPSIPDTNSDWGFPEPLERM